MRVSRVGFPNHSMLFDKTIVKGRPFAKYINRKENLNLVVLNNWGFHDHSRDIENDNYRILFLGDSFVESVQVPVDSLFTSLLEGKFRREGSPVEIINAGSGGIGTAYEYLLWKKFFYKKIRIDHIVVCFSIADLEDNNLVLSYPPLNFGVYLDSMGNTYVNSVKYPLLQSIVRKLRDYSALANTIYTRLYFLKRSYLRRKRETAGVVQGKNQTGQVETTDLYSSAWNNSADGTIRLIERWNKEASSENIKLSVIVIDSSHSDIILGGYDKEFIDAFVRKLKKLCSKYKIQILEPNFADYDPYDIYSFDGVMLGHFNYLAHRLVAKQIFLWLKEQLRQDL